MEIRFRIERKRKIERATFEVYEKQRHYEIWMWIIFKEEVILGLPDHPTLAGLVQASS